MTKPQILSLGIGTAAIGCAALAVAIPGWGRWLATWTALSCALVSAAYATNRPDLFGKRDGRLSLARALLLLPYLVAFRIGCAIIRWRRGLSPLDEVAPGLYVGGRVRGRDLPQDVALIVDLMGEFSEPSAVRRHPGYRCVPALDGHHPPDEEAFCALLDEIEATNGSVLFHCESGVGRAPTGAALALIWRGVASDPESAVELIAKERPAISPTRADFEFMHRIASRRLAPCGRS